VSEPVLMQSASNLQKVILEMLTWGSVGIAVGYGLDGPGLIPGTATFFSPPQWPDQIWGPPSLLSNGYCGLFRSG
jgi:hypothetical protein